MRRSVLAGLVAVIAAVALGQAPWASSVQAFRGVAGAQSGPQQSTHPGFWDESSSTATFTAAPSFASACQAQATLLATADATIDQGAPAQNFGSAVTLTVRSQVNKNARALIRFDLPTLGDCGVLSAHLRLYKQMGSTGRNLAIYRLASPWAESSVTWNNRPGVSGAPATAAVATAGWMTVDVSEQVLGMYRFGNNGLIVQDATEGAIFGQMQTFGAGGDERPQLVLTFG
jgi:hypothetical protein